MKVDDVASVIHPETGQRISLRRQVEIEGTAEECAERSRQFLLTLERHELRAQMQAVLADEALGLDVTERKRELCTAFSALR